MPVQAVALPAHATVTRCYRTVHLADAFAITLPPGASPDPERLARHLVAHQPAWVGWLTRLRDVLVAGFGLKTAGHLATLAAATPSERVGIFKVYSRSASEIVLGEDDRHLDFRISVLCAAAAPGRADRRLTVSTVVHCHNRLGRGYLAVIAPFHRAVVKASLRRAARLGWPVAV